MHNLQINAQRLWDSIMETAQIGGTAKGGVCRLTLTDLDRQVRDWFVAQCEEARLYRYGGRDGQYLRPPARQG